MWRNRQTKLSVVLQFVMMILIEYTTASPHLYAEEKISNTLTGDRSHLGLSRLWNIELQIPLHEYDAMQPPPAPGGFGPAAPPPAASAKKTENTRASERNLFGTEFPWAHAEVSIDGTTIKDIGIRYSGEITYFASAQSLKRPLAISFDRYVHQKYEGLTSIQLHSMPMDPDKGREAIAYKIFKAAQVPSQRTAFAEVRLTVPGKFDKELLGLYSVIESVDTRFLFDRLGTGDGLLMKPFQIRSVEYLGEDWERYKPQYRPQSQASSDQAERVIAFARLIHQSADDVFEREIASFLEIDSFLRFLAANSLTSNLENVFALGHNYHLFLNSTSNKFHFLPADLEFSLANFLLMGTAEQLMDLSLTHPYPGENKLVERLLKIKAIDNSYKQLLAELSTAAMNKDHLFQAIEEIQALTKDAINNESKAAAARNEPPRGFGPPGATGPTPPELKTFVTGRIASIQKQLSDPATGYIPAGFGFGPPPPGGSPGRGAASSPIDEAGFRDAVKVPNDFEATLYATPPQLGYPVALACAPNAQLFVAVDEQGSIGTAPGGGKVLRCVDRDGDGKVDDVSVFARMEHPRGLVYQDGLLWVLHAASLSVYRDSGSGPAESTEELVTGLTSDMVNQRGGDHATNGIRMGLDGWIYIAVGDYGCPHAIGKDGSHVSIRGGILRVRPDGNELEVFATGLRNPFDIGMDPYLNFFTRDNDDNRAGGWDIRVLHLIQSGYYGYSQHYANFPDEIMPPLGQFGGGSGVGTLFLQDERWPARYNNILLTGDWGRSEVYRHELTPHGPTFDLQQEVFLKFPRPTGIDLDANGHLYVASWRGGEASTYVGPNVGFIARISPRGIKETSSDDPRNIKLRELIDLLNAPNSVRRFQSQRELLRRGRSEEATRLLVQLAADPKSRLEGRIAAVMTLKQLDGPESHAALLELTRDRDVKEFSLRALTDRKRELTGLDPNVFAAALTDESARVRAQALISLGRLGNTSVSPQILPLTSRPEGSEMPTKKEVHAQPDPDRVIPHLAVRTLIELNAIDACLDGITGPHEKGALWALRSLHQDRAVEGLIRKLASIRSPEIRRDILVTLIRLYYREADYTGVWWGIRPVNNGPYFDPVEWQMSPRIEAVLTQALIDSDPPAKEDLRRELTRHQIPWDGLPAGTTDSSEKEITTAVVVRAADPDNPNQIGNLTYEAIVERTLKSRGDQSRGRVIFKTQSCNSCHTDADGQVLKGPHMVDIGKRYSPAELAESILRPSAKIAQGFEGYIFEMADGKTYHGFIVSQGAKSMTIREPSGLPRELKLSDVETKVTQKQSSMPEGIVATLTPDELADLIAYLQSLVSGENAVNSSEDPTATRQK